MKVYMDNITVYGESFDQCLIHLETVLHRHIERTSTKLGEMPFYGKSEHSDGAYYFIEGN